MNTSTVRFSRQSPRERSRSREWHSSPHAPLLKGAAGRSGEAALVGAARLGDRAALEALVTSHAGLVRQLARRYRCRCYSTEDLVQEGILGFLAAVERFDETRGNRLATYASFWIRQAMTRAVEQNDRMIHLPLQVTADLRRVSRLVEDRHQRLGRVPTDGELAEASSLDADRIAHVRAAAEDVASLERLTGADSDTPLLDLTEDPAAESPEERVLRAAEREALTRLVQMLPARERDVLRWRYGLEGAGPETLDEISRRMRVSRERVRQLEVRAISRLRQTVGTYGYAELTA